MKNEKNKQPSETEDDTVSMSSRVPPEFKDTVKKFAKYTKRTESMTVYYLIETNPEFQQFVKSEGVSSSAS